MWQLKCCYGGHMSKWDLSHHAVFKLLAIRSQQNFAHALSGQLSSHAQNFLVIVVRLSKSLTTLILGSSKITTVADFTALVLLRPLKL